MRHKGQIMEVFINALLYLSLLVCKSFATKDNDFVEICPDDLESLHTHDEYAEFEIWVR